MNITKSILDQDGVVTVSVSGIDSAYFDKLIETRAIEYKEQSPAGDNNEYKILVTLGGSDLLYAYGNEPFGGLILQINENGFSSAEYVLTGADEQGRSTFFARVNALFDTINGGE